MQHLIQLTPPPTLDPPQAGPAAPCSPDPLAQHRNQDIVGQAIDAVAHDATENLGPNDALK